MIIIPIMFLILIITLFLFLKITNSRTPFAKGVCTQDTYALFSYWEKAFKISGAVIFRLNSDVSLLKSSKSII